MERLKYFIVGACVLVALIVALLVNWPVCAENNKSGLHFKMESVNNTQHIEEENTGILVNHTLLDLIAAQGMKQSEFAFRIGVNRSFINRVIRGREQPTRDMMIKISKALGVDSRVIWP